MLWFVVIYIRELSSVKFMIKLCDAFLFLSPWGFEIDPQVLQPLSGIGVENLVSPANLSLNLLRKGDDHRIYVLQLAIHNFLKYII